MAAHELKILPEYFKAQKEGKKNFEIRKNDRGYQVGDLLILEEYDPETNNFTGRNMIVEITYMTDYMQKEGYVVLGTKLAELRLGIKRLAAKIMA
jgi:ASC-1-like (ASCH) protein